MTARYSLLSLAQALDDAERFEAVNCHGAKRRHPERATRVEPATSSLGIRKTRKSKLNDPANSSCGTAFARF
jgi:hypothetical protein